MSARRAAGTHPPPHLPLEGGGAKEPDWIAVLRAECEREGSSQGKVAKRLGRSGAVINQVLRGSYKGDLAGIEARVRGEFMKGIVTCPVLGTISSRDCQDHQQRPFSAASWLRVAIYRACRAGCPNFRGQK